MWNIIKNKWNQNKRLLGILFLTYLIPLINILFVISNRDRFKSAVVSICSVLSSTAAASACTIKGEKDNSGKIFHLKTVALVCAVVSFMSCIVYEMMNFLCFHELLIIAFTLVANGFTVWMNVIVNKQSDER